MKSIEIISKYERWYEYAECCSGRRWLCIEERNIYVDKESGVDFDRKNYMALRNSRIFHSRTHMEAAPDDALSREIPLQGAISIGNTFNMELENNASAPGDYLYRSGSFKWDVESGMWGIFRVVKQGIQCKCNNICRKAVSCIYRKNL